MKFYSYKFECVECNKTFTEFRADIRKVSRKKCSACKTQHKVVEFGGEDGQGCGSCIHYSAYRDDSFATPYWGKCGLNHALKNDDEYNVCGQYPGLVGYEDTCDDYEGPIGDRLE
jgi:hypothetical protein